MVLPFIPNFLMASILKILHPPAPLKMGDQMAITKIINMTFIKNSYQAYKVLRSE